MRLASLLTAVLLAALAAPATAQTTDFADVLGDTDPATPAAGMILVRLTDNPAPGTDVLVVRGQFRGLGADYVSSAVRATAAGPVALTLTAGLAETRRFGGWGAAENTFTIPDELTAALLSGTAVVTVSTAGTPAQTVRGPVTPLGVVLDGRVDESGYTTVAVKQTANAGFGPGIDATSIRLHVSSGSSFGVLAVTGRLNTASNDGIGLLIGASAGGLGPTVPAGTSLGGTPNAGHFLGAAEHPAFKADFPVAYAFALNPGGGTQSAFLDVVRYGFGDADRQADYLGAAAQDGGVAVGPPDPTANDGTSPPPLADVAFAFRNDGAPTSGLELLVPVGLLRLPVPTEGGGPQARFAAFVVSATAFFSDVTVPGAITGGNPGFDPDFGTLAGGPFSATGGGFTALADAPRGPSALRLAGPNPAASQTRLVLTLDAAQTVRVDLVDALGRTVAILHDGAASAGETAFALDVAALPPGVYAVRVAGDGLRAVQRLTVAR